MVLVLTLSLLYGADEVYASIYRCEKNGTVNYSEAPCAADAVQKDLSNANTINVVASQSSNSNEALEDGNASSNESNSTNTATKIIELNRQLDGHFYVDGLVNNIRVNFMVDTGASYVSLPADITKQAGLKSEGEVNLGTASGVYTSFHSTLKTLKLQGNVFKNIKIVATPVGTQGLLGQNILKRFDLEEKNNILKLKPNKNEDDY
ncbi:MAG: TIGR02281 family clan AA aspartic protease [Gammaproteobacteria bacterium]